MTDRWWKEQVTGIRQQLSMIMFLLMLLIAQDAYQLWGGR